MRVIAEKLASRGCAFLLLVGALIWCVPTSAQTSNSSSGSGKTSTRKPGSAAIRKGKKSRKSASRRSRGQQKIDPKRTQQIQEALIREHYLEGKPTGAWNDATQKAMQRYQADNHWQSKTTPDARALIKLGLGPDHEHLLNPDSAMTSQPQPAHSVPVSTPADPPDPTK